MKDVTTPKFPPPPRTPQNRSAFSVALAWIGRAVRRDEIDAEETVDRQAVRPDEPTDAATERQAGEAGAGDHPDRHDEPVWLGRAVDVGEGRATGDPDLSCSRIHLHIVQSAQVQDDATVNAPIPGHVVATAADRQWDAEGPRGPDGRADVFDTGGANHCDRPAIDHPVPDAPGVLESVPAGLMDSAGDLVAQGR